MNPGPELHAIDINALPHEMSLEILKHLGFKELAILSRLNGLWRNFVKKRSRNLIAQYFPYLLAQRENEIEANTFNVFKEEYRRYKRCFPKIDMSFILKALSGYLEKIEQIENQDDKITLCALCMSNGYPLPNELFKENKEKIIKQALLYAAGNGHLLVVKDLLTQAEITPPDKGQALKKAAEGGQLETVKYLSTLPITTLYTGLALYGAAIGGYFDIVKHLLTASEIRAADKGWAFKEAASVGQLDIVKHLSILPQITFDNKGEALKESSRKGHLNIVKYLLTLEINPQDKVLALKWAICGNQLEIVKLLGTLPEITLQHKVEGLIDAIRLNNLETVKHLFTQPEITSQDKSQGLVRAAREGHLEIVKHLSAQPEMTPQDKGSALIRAATCGHFKIVEHLLTLEEISLADKNEALKQAKWGMDDIILKHLSTLSKIPPISKDLALNNVEGVKHSSEQHTIDMNTLPQALSLAGNGQLLVVKDLLTSIEKAAKDFYLKYLKRAITVILNSSFLQRDKIALVRLMLATTMCLGLTIKFPLISAGWSAFLGYSSSAFLAFMLLSTLYQRYMERTFVNYNTPEKIQTITDANEIQALKTGVDAKSWWGYAKSFTVYATYRQMSAFNAGKKCALNNASETLKEVTKITISH